jgi:hypothetical protein
MSLTFSQIISQIDKNVGSNSTSYPTADKTVDINLALDHVLATIFEVGGTWQFDDANHSSIFPIITTQLNEGQRDYAFTTDGSGNRILEIYKVMVADEDGLYREITPVDITQGLPSNYYDGLDTQGQPNTYDKLGNSIILDPIPNYTRSAGLKVYINREASYFTASDTTKKPGFAGLFHDYLALRPSYFYALRNLTDSDARKWKNEMIEMENAIREHYKAREKDVVKRVTPYSNNSR